ncbi:hypothetical protein CS542_02420 [Pedobacter sp. IW39]|nr:hypothetical protein CS542_02420 [Pedobacter sp. IW39]
MVWPGKRCNRRPTVIRRGIKYRLPEQTTDDYIPLRLLYGSNTTQLRPVMILLPLPLPSSDRMICQPGYPGEEVQFKFLLQPYANLPA